MTHPDAKRRKLAWLAVGVASAISLAVGWLIITVAQADRLDNTNPAAALTWRASRPQALAALAEQEASGDQPEAAEHLAAKALVAGPLDVRALRVLAWLAERRGDHARAVQLMERAASRSQRDDASHLWMFHERLKERNFEAAYAHADVLMRNPAIRPQIAALVVAAATAEPKATDAIISRLARRPVWFTAVMQRFASDQDPSVAFQILATLKDRGVKIRPSESDLVVARLLTLDRPQEAYLAWVLLLPEAEQNSLGNVYDGGFDTAIRKGPFFWKLGRSDWAELARDADGDGNMLAVRYIGAKPVPLAQQNLVLPPGAYSLIMTAKSEMIAREPRLIWRAICGEARDQPVVTLGTPDTGGSWQTLVARFDIPPTGCASQRLELTAEPGPGAVRGWFDDIRIESAGSPG